MRSNRRLLAAGLLVFVVGAVCGAAVIASWSSRASRMYLQMTRLSFATEQEMALRQAWQAGDLRLAVAHAACQVEADQGSRAFDPTRSSWDFWFPLVGATVAEDVQWNQARGTNVEAVAHAQLAAVFERLGRSEDAGKEYAEATRITGVSDTEKLREMATTSLAKPAMGLRR